MYAATGEQGIIYSTRPPFESWNKLFTTKLCLYVNHIVIIARTGRSRGYSPAFFPFYDQLTKPTGDDKNQKKNLALITASLATQKLSLHAPSDSELSTTVFLWFRPGFRSRSAGPSPASPSSWRCLYSYSVPVCRLPRNIAFYFQ